MLCVDTACRSTAAEVHNHPWTNGVENAEAPENVITMMRRFADETKKTTGSPGSGPVSGGRSSRGGRLLTQVESSEDKDPSNVRW